MNLSTQMQFIDILQPGDATQLACKIGPLPLPQAHEVLLRVSAAGVNRLDSLQRKGLYPPPIGASPILGLEVAGEVIALGSAVSHLKLGERVCALLSGGGYAEYCVAPADLCLPIPNKMSDIEAAALPEALFTVWSNIFMRAHLGAGESLLVQGGSSGVGSFAIQLASALGHPVFATAGSRDKCEACEKMGATRAIHYKEEDFVAVIQEMTAGKGVNVILDMVGGDYVARELDCLAEEGRLCFIAFLGGKIASIDISKITRRRLTLMGSTLRARDIPFKAAVATQLRQHVWPLLNAGKIKPWIHAVFPLEAASQAHQLIESSQHIGKIVLQVLK